MKTIKKICITLILILSIGISSYLFICHRLYEQYKQNKEVSTLMQEVMNQKDFISFDQFPEYFVQATISIEDRRFYLHGGVDLIGVARAFVSQFDEDYIKSGGSTITQQTAKNLYGIYESNIWIKGSQMWMAWELEQNFSKEQIFAVYVNIINYGDNNEGIQEACQNYFGIDVSQMSIEQATILAGIPNLPSYYQLSNHYDNAKQRQYNVLVCMAQSGYISYEDIEVIFNGSVYENRLY
ncbi:biosynthetic peptidoglycan transglycosylase [Floccifex sp.]|uniref:biosynthetic peptidoglycan transglycosylase n=1 Tax=Floccifex sp. TaxID=2815810 RepID=UPI003F0FE00A